MVKYKVPQNIDVEDKVVGPLTLRQFVIILIAVGIILIFNFIFSEVARPVFWLIAILFGAAAFGLAFGTYGDQHMETIVKNAVKTTFAPKLRIWRKEEQDIQIVKKAPPKPEEAEIIPRVRSLGEVRNDLQKLANIVDSGGFSEVDLKDRTIAAGGGSAGFAPTNAVDALDENKENLENLISKTKSQAPKRDPLVSELASVSPQKQFDYPAIQVSENKILDGITKT